MARLQALLDLQSSALDLINTLQNNYGVPPPPPQSAPPLPQFTVATPDALRDKLLKLGICKRTTTALNEIYIRNVDNYCSESTESLRVLWKRLHDDGARDPLRTFNGVLEATRNQMKETLDAIFTMIVDIAVKTLGTKKRKSQPVFDQVRLQQYP